MKNSINFVLQEKGGVGKTFCASMLAQWLRDRRGETPICGDADPLTPTFSAYKALDVARVGITENGAVVQRKFDSFFESILEHDDPVVLDNGTATYMPILKYMKTNDLYSILADAGKKLILHLPIVGGDAKLMTIYGLENVLAAVQCTGAKIVVWQNEYFGVPMIDGREAADMALVADNYDTICGVVKIIDRNSDDYEGDIKLLTEKKMTRSEAQDSSHFKMFARSRIDRVFRDVYDQLDKVLL